MSAPDAPPVTLHVWRVPRRRIPAALLRMGRDRRRLRRTPGVRFAKLLGTGAGRDFGPRDAEPTRWAALVVWESPEAAAAFDATPVARAWRRIASGHCRLDLRPLASRGRWSGQEPFTTPAPRPAGHQGRAGTVLALTRARLTPRRTLTFWRAIPPVAAALHTAPGVLAAFGVGEAPVGWQGTVSVWRSAADLVEFAYRHPVHAAAIARTPREKWYAEELFARFAVLDVAGDPHVIGWGDGRNPGV